MYVYDLVAGAGSVDSAFQLYKAAKSMLSDGGFNLRKWSSNLPSSSLRATIDSDCKAKLVVEGVNESEPKPDKSMVS